MRVAEAHKALAAADPAAAQRLRPSDTTRVARALEVVRSTGRPLAEWQRERAGGIAGRVPLVPIVLLPPRDWLYRRCDERFERMTGPEGVEEVRRLLARRLDPTLPVMRAIGVAEIAALATGALAREEAVERGRTATRQYAKRQYTWFRGQPPEDWPRFAEPLDCPGLANALADLDARLAR
jgi:tRNA dimethylallyltransferase